MKYNRLSAHKHNHIRCFCANITATAYAQIVGVKGNTVNSQYNEFQHKILLAVACLSADKARQVAKSKTCGKLVIT